MRKLFTPTFVWLVYFSGHIEVFIIVAFEAFLRLCHAIGIRAIETNLFTGIESRTENHQNEHCPFHRIDFRN